MKNYIILTLIICNFFSIVWAQIPVLTNEGYILMDEDGDTYNKEPYEFIGVEKSDMHIVFSKGSFGYMSDTGKMIINPQYDIAYPFKGDYALVGKDEKYYHINKANSVLDTLDQPYAPKVIENYFLLIDNEDISHVAFRNGEIIYQTKDSLFLTKRSGLIQWNKRQKKVLLLRPSYYRKAVMPIRELKDIDSLIITREGHLITFHKKNGNNVFTVLDNAGRDLIVKEATTEIDYKSIKVFGIMIYVPSKSDYLLDEYSDYDYGSKYYWDTDKMYYTQINQRVPHSLYLGYNYTNELVARIKGSAKYVPFSGSKIEGNKLFDEIGTKGGNYLPVKIEDDWFLWSRRKDTLISVDFRYFHPIGIQESTYFGSNDGKKWALVNFEKGVVTEEKYSLPKNNPLFRSNLVSLHEDSPNPYIWEKKMVRVKEGGVYHLLNLNGKKLLTENEKNLKRIETFIKNTFNFEGKQLPITKNLQNQLARNRISIRIIKDADNTNLYLANRTKQNQELAHGGYYEITLQAKDRDGMWKSITKFVPPFGVDYNSETSLLKDHYVKNALPKFSGNFKTELRAVLSYSNNSFEHEIISNEIKVSINYAKFWVDKYYHLYGIE
ncbi:MAG: WG repeat-containing protein [Psychroserpens sp.]|nr:WG repeat-containing protein [Psychroserpens sp.]